MQDLGVGGYLGNWWGHDGSRLYYLDLRDPTRVRAKTVGVGVTYDRNFALIRLDPKIEASPEMCFFGGPSGMYAGDTRDTKVLHH